MANESKIHDNRFWEKWKKSGAIANQNNVKPENRVTLIVHAVANWLSGDNAGKQTLSLGERIVHQGIGSDGNKWKVTAPITFKVVEGHNVQPGDEVEV